MYNKNAKYPFLNEKLTKEAHIEDILSEIDARQANWLRQESNELATAENLSESRNIKIPLTQKRLTNIQYLIDLLVKNHPAEIRPIFSFKFFANPANKNMKIEEKSEYTLLMKDSEFNRLQDERDKDSAVNLNELIKNFRFFNLTRLLLMAQNRTHLIGVVKTQVKINIFPFKYFSLDKNGQLIDEDYCFHKDNYETVKSQLDLDDIKRIILMNESIVEKRLKSVGILNSSVHDYRDNKLDYILNILSDYLTQSFDRSNEIKIKNFKHLRDCILKVDKLMDPAARFDKEMLEYLHEKFITTDSNIILLFPDMTTELLNQWESEKISSGKLIAHSYKNIKYFIDPAQFIEKYEPLINTVISHEDLQKADENHYKDDIFTVDLLTDAGQTLLETSQNIQITFGGNENVEKLKTLIDRYRSYKKRIKAISKTEELPDKKGFLASLEKLVNSILMLFSRDKQDNPNNPQKSNKTKKSIKDLPKETREIYKEIIFKSTILTPISDFIEIIPENQDKLETLISDLRKNNLRIVIPVYNARKLLYEKRSKKYLMSDIEFLLADPYVVNSPESINEYMDLITGFQLKDDTLSGNALVVIEKYLLSLYRQNKAKKKRKN